MTRTLRLIILIASFYVSGCDTPSKIALLPKDATILAFGDSLTFGTGARPEQSYPAILQNLTGRTVINAGIPGETSTPGLQRLESVLKELKPDLLILCHGGNDLLKRSDSATLLHNLRKMILAARAWDVPVVLLGVPTPRIAFLDSAPAYDEIARQFELPYEADAIPNILANRNLKSDTVHPNAEGYRELANAVYQLLQESGAI